MNSLALKLRHLASAIIEVADAIQKEEALPIQLGKASYLRNKGVVKRGIRITRLPKSQKQILDALIDSKGVPVTRAELNVIRFGAEAINMDSRTTDTQVSQLRKVLGQEVIKTDFARGYFIE